MKAVIYILLSVTLMISDTVEEMNSYDEIDPVVEMLLNGEYYDDKAEVMPNDNSKKDHEAAVDSVPILYPDGVWRCGNCSDIEKMKLLYSEVYDHKTNYDKSYENISMEVQIGLSLKNMRCITLKADEEMDVRLVTGACTGEQATLGVVRAAHWIVTVYG